MILSYACNCSGFSRRCYHNECYCTFDYYLPLTSINVDAIAGLIVSAIVIWSGISIAKDTLEPLIGERVPAELYQKITDIVESYDGIVGTHDLIVHNYGPNRSMATIHAEVPNDINIDVSHEIIDKIERDVKKI